MIQSAASLLTALLAVIVALGGYVRFVLVRANMGAEFDVALTTLGGSDEGIAAEVSCSVRNLGANTLVVTRVAVRTRYSTPADQGHQYRDEPVLSGVVRGTGSNDRWIEVFPQPKQVSKPGSARAVGLEKRSVVFPAGTQAYRKPLFLPSATEIVSVWATCDYHVQAGRLTHWLVRLVLRPRKDLDFTLGLKDHRVRKTVRMEL